MSFLFQCDICGSVVTIDNMEQVTYSILRGNNVLWQGHICSNCLENISDKLKGVLSGKGDQGTSEKGTTKDDQKMVETAK